MSQSAVNNYERMEESIDNALAGLNLVKEYFTEIKKEKKDASEPVELQVYKIIEDDLKLLSIERYHDFEDCIVNIKDFDSFFEQCLFLAIMKGVHVLIEGKGTSFIKDRFIVRYNFENEDNPFYEILEVMYEVINFPKFWYYSTKKRCEMAKSIMLDFFEINLLDWWFKS
jgi:hypothetical protein